MSIRDKILSLVCLYIILCNIFYSSQFFVLVFSSIFIENISHFNKKMKEKD